MSDRLSYRTTHKLLASSLKDCLTDLAILSGDVVGHSDVTWQDVAATAAINLRHLAKLIEQARMGHAEPMLVFPSPAEIIEGL